jgi:hypothetical protein
MKASEDVTAVAHSFADTYQTTFSLYSGSSGPNSGISYNSTNPFGLYVNYNYTTPYNASELTFSTELVLTQQRWKRPAFIRCQRE